MKLIIGISCMVLVIGLGIFTIYFGLQYNDMLFYIGIGSLMGISFLGLIISRFVSSASGEE